MKLTLKDKAYLYNNGYSLEDVKQIECCIRHTIYYDKEDKCISRKKAIEILGREKWLSGMSRSSFHWSAVRINEDTNEEVYFDSSAFFKNYNLYIL